MAKSVVPAAWVVGILLGLWITGILAMIILVIKSSLRLRTLEKSALPLQNPSADCISVA